MSKREKILDDWVDAVRAMDPERALQEATPDFVFYDGLLPAPVTRETFPEYLLGWEARMKLIGGTGRYEVIDEVIQDDGITLLKWGWWQFTGTNVQGASLVKITNNGVLYEKIAYYSPDSA